MNIILVQSELRKRFANLSDYYFEIQLDQT